MLHDNEIAVPHVLNIFIKYKIREREKNDLGNTLLSIDQKRNFGELWHCSILLLGDHRLLDHGHSS